MKNLENKLQTVSSLDEAIKIVDATKESQSFIIDQDDNFSIEIFVVYDSCEVEEGVFNSFARLESYEPSDYCKQYLIAEDTEAGCFFYNQSENAGNCYKLADGNLKIEESIKLFFPDAVKLSFITEENGYYESSHYYFSKSEPKKLSDINLFEELNLSIDSDIEKKYKLSIDDDFNTFINSIIISTIENNGDLNDIEYIANDSIDQLTNPVFYIKGGFQKAIQTAKNEGEVTIYEIKHCNLAKECKCSGQLMFTNAAWSTSKESLEEELQRWIEGSEGKDCGYDIIDIEIDFIEEIENN